MCGCAGRATRTVWHVLYPDGSRGPDHLTEHEARQENVKRGGIGTVLAAQVPK